MSPIQCVQKFLFAAGMLAAAGCATRETEPRETALDPAVAVIADAVAETAESNRIVAEIEKRRAGLGVRNADAEAAPSLSALGQASDEEVTIDWEGPLEPLVRSLALRMDAELRILGGSPVQPVFIAVSYSGRSYREALGAIDASVFGFADVDLVDNGAAVELRYAQ